MTTGLDSDGPGPDARLTGAGAAGAGRALTSGGEAFRVAGPDAGASGPGWGGLKAA